MGRSLRINVQKAGHSPLCKSVSHGVVSHQPYQERTTPFHLVLETMIVVTNFVVVEWMKHFKLNINILVKLGFGWVSKWCGPKKNMPIFKLQLLSPPKFAQLFSHKCCLKLT